MNCKYCSHECTAVDFATLRNLCEHLYLDALAKKRHPSFSATIPRYYREGFQSSLPNAIATSSAREELALDQ